MQWFGKQIPFTRFLGQVDQDDPTNIPVGAAALCRNVDFTRDSPGPSSATTRAGVNLAIQMIGLNGQPSTDPATGGIFFRYEPQLATDAALFPPDGYFSMPILFEGGGCLQREYPVGSGHCMKLPASSLFTPPAQASMLGAAANNRAWAAFSDLKTPKGYGVSINPKAIMQNQAGAVNPLGMRPVGWHWEAGTDILEGEICTPGSPVTGNGHTYQAQNSGTTGANEPVWPLTEGGAVVDNPGPNQVIWVEKTMVLANRLPAPAAPTLTRDPGAGTFAANLDVYVRLALDNNQGLTLPSDAASIMLTVLNDAVQVAIPALADLAGWIQTLDTPYIPIGATVYVASVAHGALAPATSAYQQFGAMAALGSTVLVTTDGTGAAPPTKCTARVTPGQLPTPDVAPIIQRDPAAGTFPAGRDVYVRKTYTNSLGETKPGPASFVVNTVANDAVQVTVDEPEDDFNNPLYSIDQIGIYEADVPTGTPAPPADQFSLVGYSSVGSTVTISTSAAGPNPPTVNTTGPAGNIAADSSTGGPNGTQGYRWAVPLWYNGNSTVSGFTIAAAVKCDVDEDGWEIGVFNIPDGPSYVRAKLIAFTSANSVQEGPYSWIGVVNLVVPTQDVVYPTKTLIDGVEQSATAVLDNTTTSMIVNFTDTYLSNSNNVTDRTDILAPVKACRIDFLKTINALAFSGVLGYSGGGLISISGDIESIYADTGVIPFPADGQKCFGFTDKYKSVIFALREEGGYAIQPNTGNPSGWDVVQRWDQVGPCGFRAWDAIGKFIIFVHRSGVYKYDESDPDLMTKEIPRRWSEINWDAAEQISVTIDEDTHTVRIMVPTGQSTVNNEEFCLSYIEGWQNPLHFSPYAQREVAMDAARRWSFNDIAANFAIRMNRVLPKGPAFIDGPNWDEMPDPAYKKSQLLFFDSAPDGGVQARTPGVYSDNGTGIDSQYETCSAGMMQAVCKPEGINLNASGGGMIYACFLAARDQETGEDGPSNEVPLGDGYFMLDPNQKTGITLKCEPAINEFFRVRITNGKKAGSWFSLKSMMVYMIPFTVGRGSWEMN